MRPSKRPCGLKGAVRSGKRARELVSTIFINLQKTINAQLLDKNFLLAKLIHFPG
jgi:hypothetical protein